MNREPQTTVEIDGGESFDLNVDETRVVALLIGTGMCHVEVEAECVDMSKVESLKDEMCLPVPCGSAH